MVRLLRSTFWPPMFSGSMAPAIPALNVAAAENAVVPLKAS
ncbi:hypothetical protein AC58_5067 [Escherichia coli 3-105-05_S3_C3]|nr:hypothetical protein AC58_5067 [Escherichia coli 3-105-05_S3_C3]